MNDGLPDQSSTKGCGIVEGFHRDDLIAPILERRPGQRGEWLLPAEPPVKGQRVKVQVITDTGAWGILRGASMKSAPGS